MRRCSTARDRPQAFGRDAGAAKGYRPLSVPSVGSHQRLLQRMSHLHISTYNQTFIRLTSIFPTARNPSPRPPRLGRILRRRRFLRLRCQRVLLQARRRSAPFSLPSLPLFVLTESPSLSLLQRRPRRRRPTRPTKGLLCRRLSTQHQGSSLAQVGPLCAV